MTTQAADSKKRSAGSTTDEPPQKKLKLAHISDTVAIDDKTRDINKEITLIEGLTLLPKFISRQQHDELLSFLDKQPWSTALSRRVQQYGYEYDYSKLNQRPMPTTPIPAELQPFLKLLVEAKLMPRLAEQVIINEYTPGQGIAPHIDQVKHFGDVICSLSLGSACVMDFKHKTSDESRSLVLEPSSALVLSGTARYDWMHSIAKRKTDTLREGRVIHRRRRVSVTCRMMK